MILIGSRAANMRGVKLRTNIERCDWDFVTTPEYFSRNIQNRKDFELKESSKYPGKWSGKFFDQKIEIDATNNPSNYLLMLHFFSYEMATYVEDLRVRCTIPTINLLYIIKRSHANHAIHFEKTIHDLLKLKKHITEFSNYEIAVLNARKAEANDRYAYMKKKINLNVPNEKFFDQSKHVRKFNHDDLHRIFAYHDKPIFEMVKKDPTKAKVDKDLFFSLTKENQLNMIREESAVIGFERFFIPNNEEGDLNTVYRMGFLKFIKDLCKGWCQDFAIDNIEHLIAPNVNFVEKYRNAKEKLNDA